MAASPNGHVEIVRLLLHAGADSNLANSLGATALTAASRTGHAEVVQLLLEANADKDLAHNDGFTALQLASFKGRVDVARILLDAGADTNLADGVGITALMMASQNGHVELVHMLLGAGADRNLPNRDGDTALMAASLKGHVEIVRLLLHAGADSNLANSLGATALTAASRTGHAEVVRLLLQANADKNLAHNDGFTALQLASFKNHVGVVRLLLDAGADKNLAESMGFTALMLASAGGHAEVARLLLDAGADKNLANNSGFNALQLASAGGHVQVSNFLSVLRDLGMLGTGWQILSSTVSTQNLEEFPIGYMRWEDVSKGEKWPQFADIWTKLSADDVVGPEARQRYKLDNLRVALEDMRSDVVTDSFFDDTSLLKTSESFLFDAGYTFILAINSLLNKGNSLTDIKGELLLNEVRATVFTGITGDVSFNDNGDRLASYQLLNIQQGSGGNVEIKVGLFSATAGTLNLTEDPYWMDGLRGARPPDALVKCSPGFYQEEISKQCYPCPRGMYCLGGDATFSRCPRGTFANETGMSNCTDCDVGRFAAKVGSAECDECLPGTYADVTGREVCMKCLRGTYAPLSEATSCIGCSMNRITEERGSEFESDCKCAEGTFMCNATGCQPCPEGLFCPMGVGLPVQREGYWTPAATPGQCDFSVLRCRSPSQCPMNELGSCADGRTGMACNNCQQGRFALEDGSCQECQAADALPATIMAIVVLLILILLLSSINADLNQQSLSILTVAAIGGQMVMAVQALGSIRQLTVNWVPPVHDLIQLTQLLTFDFDIIRISCVYGVDSPVLKFVSQLLACPAGFGIILCAWGLAKLRGKQMSWDSVFNLCGVMTFAFFITVTLAALTPFQCLPNPNNQWSLASNPGIICWASDEHIALIGLAVIGIICYPVAILVWATYTTVMYPARIHSGAGLQLVHRHRFLFQRFKPECYYFGLVLLVRNALVALFPVLFVAVPSLQVVLMGLIFVVSAAMQIRAWPWRTEIANFADLVMTCLLQIVLLGAAPLLEIDKDKSSELLGWLLFFAVLGPCVAGAVALGFTLYRYYMPKMLFGIFLCHHKGGAGSLCRLIKLLVSRHSSTNVFLDSDQLEDLDLIFNTIRATTKSVVVVLTPELLKRMWCAGEIVTAFKNNIATVPLVCDGYTQLTDDDIEEIPSVWTAQQKQILANYGIRMEHVKEAYMWLRDTLLSLTMHRFGRPEQKEEVVVTMLQRCKVPLKAIRYADSVWAPTHLQRPRILITGAVTDAEALDACEVFQILARGQLRVDTAVVRTAGDIVRLKPWAYYFVVLFSRGMLRDPRFAKILLATGAGLRDNKTMEVLEERTLEIVTVSADVGFEFPSADFFQELEEHGLGQADLGPETGPRLSKAYRSLLNILALPLSPLGSEGLLHKQVSEISRRFRRYKDPALALAMDAADDAKIEKEQGPRPSQAPVVDKPVKPSIPDLEEVDIDIDNFEDLRKNIRSEEL
eukprot:s2265_g2.t2